MEQIFRLRYDVYVEECRYIDSDDYPDGLEHDKYDSQAQHFAAIDSEGDVVGAIRLILPGRHPLPLEQKSSLFLNPRKICPQLRFAEISRLIVSEKFRKKKDFLRLCEDSKNCPSKYSDALSRCIAKCITIGLCSSVFAESKRLDITHWYALMERKLYVLFAKYGFKFTCIGPEVSYFGPVFPYVVSISDIERSIQNFIFQHNCPILESHFVPVFQRAN